MTQLSTFVVYIILKVITKRKFKYLCKKPLLITLEKLKKYVYYKQQKSSK